MKNFKLHKKQYAYVVLFFILALVLLLVAYYPALSASHFSTDDDSLINIPQIKKAFELESLRSVFQPGNNPDYYPVRDMSYMIDQYFWNSNPLQSRLHQLFLFWISSIVLFLILTEMQISIFTSLAVSIVWLLHPYHAETIMWISARKDILAMLFALLAVYFSINSISRKNVSKMWLSLFFYVLSLLAKASFTLLPIVLILNLCLGFSQIEDKKMHKPIFFSILLMLFSSLGQNLYYSSVNNMKHFIPFIDRVATSITALGRMCLGWFIFNVNAVDLNNEGDWLRLNFNFFYMGLLVWGIMLSLVLFSLRRRNKKILYSCILPFLLYVPTSGLFFPHGIFYSTRYFEPVGLTLIILFGAWTKEWSKKIISILAFFLLIPIVFGMFSEGKVWSKNINVREKALAVTPDNLNLKALLLFDMVNETRGANFSDEIKQKKFLIGKNLIEECNKPKLGSINENCRVFFYQAYYINRFNKKYQESEMYFKKTMSLLRNIDPIPPAYERLQIEQMILDGHVDKLYLQNWIKREPYLPSPEYRILFLIANCLLGKPARDIKNYFILKNLLIESEIEIYIKENVNVDIVKQLKFCPL